MTVKEMAVKLRVHPVTIRRSIESGRIQAFKVGKGERSSWRIPETEIDRMATFDLMKVVEKEAEKRSK